MFCFHCGAPQVLLGQELRELAEIQQAPAAADGASSNGMPTPAEDPTIVQWQPMLRIVLAVSACCAVFVFLLPPVSLVVPAIALALYTSRYRLTRITAGLGARIGLLCGLVMATLTGAMSASSSLFLRLRTQELASFDNAMAAQIQQFHDRLVAQNVPDPAGTTAFLSIPEFRVGMVLSGFVLAAVIFLAIVTFSGALAGFARSKTTPRAGA